MLVDYHMHTDHSVDGHASIRDVCRRAREAGLAEIAITDHFDNNPADPGVGLFNAERWFEDLALARDEMGDRLTIRGGIEIGEPHEYRRAVEDMTSWPFDMIIGAVHYIGRRGVHEALFDELPLADALNAYFDLALQIASCELVDVLGHLDYFQRYTISRGLPAFEPRDYEPQIRDVLRAVIRHGLALEVNTSGLRQEPGVSFPGRTILSWYYEMGGRAVTVGSDAHYLEHVGANIMDAVELLRDLEFETLCVYRRRRRRTIPLPTP